MLSSFFADFDRSGDRPIVAADVVLGISLAAVAVLSGFFVDANRPDTIEPETWWHWLLMVMPAVMVIVRRTRPLTTLLVAAVAQALVWVVGLPDVLLPMLVLLYSASSEGGDRGVGVSVALTVVLTAVTTIGVIVTDDVTPYLVPLIAISFVTAIAGGANAARQRRLAGELATAVAETRLRSEHERTAAIADERAHIARELHDVVGHTLSVIAVRAEAAHRVGGQNPGAAHDAVAAIASTARSALTDTRRVLAGLRAEAELELAPPPDRDAIRHLVTELSDAGIDASITMTGDELPVTSPLVVGGAYRIVQESLTNAVKHGPPDVRIEVEVASRTDRLEIQVRSTLGAAGDSADDPTEGSGLAGMAERAEVLGGSLVVEVENDHFVVRAELPTDDTRVPDRTSPEDGVPTR